MDLIKKLTGKNPADYESVAKSLVDNSDVELFAKLVKQDDFLFDFIKTNVAKRIQNACNKENYLHLLSFLKHYSPSYDTMIARVLHSFSGDELLPEMKELFLNGTDSQKAYAVKYFSFVTPERLEEIVPLLRQTADSSYEPLAMNSIEVLSILKDEESKNQALLKLKSEDEFLQYDGVRFLAQYGAKDALGEIIDVMKTSTLSENIASEITYLIPIEELIKTNFDDAVLVLCIIINAIPEIIPPSAVCEYALSEIFESLPLTSSSAVLFRLAKDKVQELLSNEEYLFDCDKNTKDEINNLNNILSRYDNNKLKSIFYDELYDGSDFVFFAVDFVDELEELEALLDSSNQTLVLKVLTILKEKESLSSAHKETALKSVTSEDIRLAITVL